MALTVHVHPSPDCVDVLPDGQLHYVSDGHLVLTGPIDGHVVTADGTRYHVGPDVIEVASQEHAVEVNNLIGARHEAEGHPLHDDEHPFIHTPITLEGALAYAAEHSEG